VVLAAVSSRSDIDPCNPKVALQINHPKLLGTVHCVIDGIATIEPVGVAVIYPLRNSSPTCRALCGRFPPGNVKAPPPNFEQMMKNIQQIKLIK